MLARRRPATSRRSDGRMGIQVDIKVSVREVEAESKVHLLIAATPRPP
jgi:hypothetical protein